MADKKNPTISSSSRSDEPQKGASGTEQPHPAVPVSEGADAAVDREYVENGDKPDKTTIAQLEVTDD